MNMSYVRFENTLRDLQDCEANLFDAKLSAEETAARTKLLELCASMSAQWEARSGNDADDAEFSEMEKLQEQLEELLDVQDTAESDGEQEEVQRDIDKVGLAIHRLEEKMLGQFGSEAAR